MKIEFDYYLIMMSILFKARLTDRDLNHQTIRTSNRVVTHQSCYNPHGLTEGHSPLGINAKQYKTILYSVHQKQVRHIIIKIVVYYKRSYCKQLSICNDHPIKDSFTINTVQIHIQIPRRGIKQRSTKLYIVNKMYSKCC